MRWSLPRPEAAMAALCVGAAVAGCEGGSPGPAPEGFPQERDVSDGVAHLVGAEEGDGVGEGALASGDLTGDGVDDLVVGVPRARAPEDRPGVVWVEPGPLAGTRSLADAAILVEGSGPGDLAGVAVVVADLTGDGRADLAVGAPRDEWSVPGPGRVHVFPGPLDGTILWDDAPIRIEGSDGDQAGRCLGVGDVTGDGAPDLVVGAPGVPGGAGSHPAGAVYVVAGPLAGGVMALDDAYAAVRMDWSEPSSRLGSALVLAAGPDGVLHVWAGAPGLTVEGQDWGGAVHLPGPVPAGDRDVSSVGTVFLPETFQTGAGRMLAAGGDLDGDGAGDVLVGSDLATVYGPEDGQAWVVAAGTEAATLADATVASVRLDDHPDPGDYFDMAPQPSAAVHDLDGDGVADLVIGAAIDYVSADAARAAVPDWWGRAYVLLGPLAGLHDLTEADFVLRRDASDASAAGASLAAVPDLTGDSAADVVVGDPAWGPEAVWAGRVSVLSDWGP